VPIVAPTTTTPEYALVIFDADGAEVAEADGSELSETIAAHIARDDVTDVVLMCHGWLDDLVDAKNTYRAWLTAARGLDWPGTRPPLVIGVHWPSKPLPAEVQTGAPAPVKDSLREGVLLTALENAGADVVDFLSFWSMRERAITLGSTDAGLGRLLARIFDACASAGAGAGVRVHLVGHSLGCVALSGALVFAGAARGPHAASFMLVQAAESAWAFSESAPFLTGGHGRYREVVSDGLVDGAMIATTSSHDGALDVLYRLGMEFVLQRSYAVASAMPARSAALGATGFGFSPPLTTAHSLPDLKPGATRFSLAAGDQYSIDCSALISDHNDVAHVELARLFFAAVAL
jgi:hypothetical protein